MPLKNHRHALHVLPAAVELELDVGNLDSCSVVGLAWRNDGVSLVQISLESDVLIQFATSGSELW